MPEITSALIKELRERTGAGMMTCKEALQETQGDLDAAIVYLREKMGSKLGDRGGRTAAEGVVAVTIVDRQDGAIIELNSETDFVARSDDFKAFARELAAQVVKQKGHSVEVVLAQPSTVDGGMTMQDRLQDLFTKLRENIVFRRLEFIATDERGAVAGYVHAPANDKIGVLVELEAGSPEAARSDEVQSLGREIAMQVAAARPRYRSRQDVPEEVLATERQIARTQAINEGRPEAALEKVVEGRVRKFFEDVVLLEQPYVRDPKMSVGQLLQNAGVSLRRFVRYEVGERAGGDSEQTV